MSTLRVDFYPVPGTDTYKVRYRKVGATDYTTVETSLYNVEVEVDTGFSYEGDVEGSCGLKTPFLAVYPYKHCNDTVFVNNVRDTGYITHPSAYYNVAGTESTSLTLAWVANERANRFSVYTLDNVLVATSGWVGVADYPGPWGASLDTPEVGSFSFPRNGENLFRVEAVAAPHETLDDSCYFSLQCSVNTIPRIPMRLSPVRFSSITQVCSANPTGLNYVNVYSQTGEFINGIPLYWDEAGQSVVADAYYKREDNAYVIMQGGVVIETTGMCSAEDSNGCLAAGTLVTLWNGDQKPVEQLKAGDELYTKRLVQLSNGLDDTATLNWFSHAATLQPARTKVKSLTPVRSQGVYDFNGIIRTSPDHIHLVHDSEKYLFKRSHQVSLADALVDGEGILIPLTRISYHGEVQQVYRVDTEEIDLFLANGILTHNKEESV